MKKKVRAVQRTGVVLERRGVDTVDIGKGSCRVSRPKRKKKTPSRLALAYVTHDDVVRTWRLSPGPDLSRIATQLSSDRIHDAVRFRIGMEGGGGGGQEKKGRRIGGHYFLLLLLAFPEGTLEV